MSFVPVIAYCLLLGANTEIPSDPHKCMFADEQSEVLNERQCEDFALQLPRDELIYRKARYHLGVKFPNLKEEDKLEYFVWCIEKEKLKDFYNGFGMNVIEEH